MRLEKGKAVARTARKKRLMRHRGFTLVEVLVTIGIIGLLAGTMMLTRYGGESSAEAMSILNDLRVMKAGAILFMAESGNLVSAGNVNYAERLGKYMDHRRVINDPVRYAFFVQDGSSWVGVQLKGRPRVNEILEGKAALHYATPLYGTADITTPPVLTAGNLFKKAHAVIWTRVR